MVGEYVAMEKNVCPICGTLFDTGAILIDKRLQTIKQPAVTGSSLCPEHAKLHGEGYLALVGVDPARSPKGDALKTQDAYRTGRVMHIKYTVFKQIITRPVNNDLPMVFVEDDVIDAIQAMVKEDVK